MSDSNNRDQPVIYIDMDGVLTNFNHTYTKLQKKFKVKKTDAEFFYKCIKEEDLFGSLLSMNGYNELVDILNYITNTSTIKVFILSSMGCDKKSELFNLAYRQKIKWLVRHKIIFPLIPTPSIEAKSSIVKITKDVIVDDNVKLISDLTKECHNIRNLQGSGILQNDSDRIILHDPNNMDNTLNKLIMCLKNIMKY